jgi:transcription initiation factor TFIID subunit 9B
MGVHAYTERVPLQLLDFAYRYTSGIISDAISYEPPAPTTSSNNKKKGPAGGGNEDGEGVGLNAIRTAVGARSAQQFMTRGGLSKEFMAEVASERNRVALPRVEREFGVRMPPERYCFTGVGWGVKESWEEEVDVEAEESMEGVAGIGEGGPVGAVDGGQEEDGDMVMGGLDEEEDVDEEEFEDAMGLGGDQSMDG